MLGLSPLFQYRCHTYRTVLDKTNTSNITLSGEKKKSMCWRTLVTPTSAMWRGTLPSKNTLLQKQITEFSFLNVTCLTQCAACFSGGNQQPYALEWACMDNWWRATPSFRRKHSPSPPRLFFPLPNSHSIFDLSLPIFKWNQQSIFQIYVWNYTSKFNWKPRTMDSNEFLIILNFIVFLPSLLTTVCLKVINYLSLSFES